MSAELALINTSYSSVDEMVRRRDMLYEFTSRVMKEGLDYGVVPGTDRKTLLKPGAEKLCTLFNFVPQFEIINQIEDWQGERTNGEPLFYYLYRCSLYRNGELVAQGDGSANSRENKYRYRWINEEQAKYIPGYESFAQRGGKQAVFEPEFAIDKAQTDGPYGKPAEYWQTFRDAIANGGATFEKKMLGKKGPFDGFSVVMDKTQYRVPNPDVFDLINTLQKMSQKRSLTAVVLIAANASELYSQDLDDMVPEVVHTPVGKVNRETGEVYEEQSEAAAPEPTEEEKAAKKALAALKSRRLSVMADFKKDFAADSLAEWLPASAIVRTENDTSVHTGRTFGQLGDLDLDVVQENMSDAREEAHNTEKALVAKAKAMGYEGSSRILLQSLTGKTDYKIADVIDAWKDDKVDWNAVCAEADDRSKAKEAEETQTIANVRAYGA